MTADLSGKFDYNSLVMMLRNKGVANKDLASATRKIGADNNIDDIKELDKSKDITIDSSIFNNINETNATNPFSEKSESELLKSYGINPEEKLTNLPEIYNDSEYEIADYDDYYGFGSSETTNKENNATETIPTVDKNLLNSALFTSNLKQNEETSDASNTEEDNKGLLMEMDMQNDSFNPHG